LKRKLKDKKETAEKKQQIAALIHNAAI